MEEELITHLDSDAGAVVRYGPVLYVVWRNPDTVEPVPYADQAANAMVRRYGRGRNLLYVHRAPDGVGRHGNETREAVMAHFDRTEPYFRAAALAIEATGFAGAAVRSVTAGVLLVRRNGPVSKVFNDARVGVRWLETMADPSAPFDAEAMIRKLRAQELCRVVGLEADYA